MSRRVVVTGIGMVTPVGLDTESSWKALLEGRSGVGPISLFDASSFPTRIAAEVRGFQLDRYLREAEAWREHSRNTVFALAAGKMAAEDSGLLDDPGLDRDRFGIYLGSGEGQHDFLPFVGLLHRSSQGQTGGKVDPAVSRELLAGIEDYARGLVPLVVPLTMLRHYVKRAEIAYLAGQLYLDPHPKELMLRNQV